MIAMDTEHKSISISMKKKSIVLFVLLVLVCSCSSLDITVTVPGTTRQATTTRQTTTTSTTTTTTTTTTTSTAFPQFFGGVPTNKTTCPQPIILLPEDQLHDHVQIAIPVAAYSLTGLKCMWISYVNGTTGVVTDLVTDTLALLVSCSSQTFQLKTVLNAIDAESPGTPYTQWSIGLGAAVFAFRNFTVVVPMGQNYTFRFSYQPLGSQLINTCTFSVSVSSSAATSQVETTMQTITALATTMATNTTEQQQQQIAESLDDIIPALLTVLSNQTDLSPLQFQLYLNLLANADAVLKALSPTALALVNTTALLTIIDRMFARVTPANVISANGNSNTTFSLRTVLEHVAGILASRFDGSGISAGSMTISTRVPSSISAEFNKSSQYAAFTTPPLTFASIQWYITVDDRLLPLPDDTVDVVSAVVSLQADSQISNTNITFMPTFVFPNISCATANGGQNTWHRSGLPITGSVPGTLVCPITASNIWTSYALVAPVPKTGNSFRSQLLSAQSTLRLNADPAATYAQLASDMGPMAGAANSMDIEDWSLSVQLINDAAAASTSSSSSSLSSMSPSTVTSLLSSANQLAMVPRSTLRTADSQYSSLASLRSSFTALGVALLAGMNVSTGTPVRSQGDFVTVEMVMINSTQTGYKYSGNGTVGSVTNDVLFSIPAGVMPTTGLTTLSFVSYTDDRLFTTSDTLGSPVISASIVNMDTSRLSIPAWFTVPVSSGSGSSQANLTCAYFIESNNTWSTIGMRTVNTTSTSMTCSTWHLTNFAVLVDASGSSSSISSEHATALNLITIIGCSLSLFGIVVTFCVHLFYADLRKTPASKMLLNLCVALGIALALFLLASQYQGNTEQCQALGLTLHYFWLAALCWMVVEAVHLYAVTVIVLTVNVSLRLKLYFFFAWTIPGLIVGITVAVRGISVYGGSSFCWINSTQALIGAFLVPLAVAMLINVVLFVIIFHTLRRSLHAHRKRSSLSGQPLPPKYRQNYREARAAVALVFLLGLAWLFGGLIDPGNASAGLAFQYLFAIFVGLQGFGIFIFHCFYNDQVVVVMNAHRDRSRFRKSQLGMSNSSHVKSAKKPAVLKATTSTSRDSISTSVMTTETTAMNPVALTVEESTMSMEDNNDEPPIQLGPRTDGYLHVSEEPDGLLTTAAAETTTTTTTTTSTAETAETTATPSISSE